MSTWLGPVPVPAPSWTTSATPFMASPEGDALSTHLTERTTEAWTPSQGPAAAAVQQLHWALEAAPGLRVLSLPESEDFCNTLFLYKFYDSVHPIFFIFLFEKCENLIILLLRFLQECRRAHCEGKYLTCLILVATLLRVLGIKN